MGTFPQISGELSRESDEAFTARQAAAAAAVKDRVGFIVHCRPAAIIPIVIRLEQASGSWILTPLKSSHWLSDEQKAKGAQDTDAIKQITLNDQASRQIPSKALEAFLFLSLFCGCK